MSLDHQIQPFPVTQGELAVAAKADTHPLHQAALRLSEAHTGRSRIRAKDLVGLLLCHGARAWRASQPVGHARVRAMTPAGHRAVRLRLR